jgi:RimJ/RimL family protein N-acetyltransferase
MMSDVLLRDVTEGDLPILFEHQLDPDANEMAAFPARDRDDFLTHWAKILADETVIKKTILFDGQVAGNIVSFEQSGEREVGYWIGKKYWGKGIATRALSGFLSHETTRPLYAQVAKHNAASIRVLEKCGFTLAGEEEESSNLGAKGGTIVRAETESHKAEDYDNVVALSFGSANHDPTAFPQPERCMLDRSPNRHVTFSAGVHLCLGAPVARMEMEITLQEFTRRVPSFKLAPGESVTWKKRGDRRGLDRLPVVLDFGKSNSSVGSGRKRKDQA